MTVYRDAAHCIARIMSIDTNTCTAQSGWQRLYRSGCDEVIPAGCGLTAEERLTQDAMTRSRVKKMLPQSQWYAIVAKYSINTGEVEDSIVWLAAHLGSLPAHHLFRLKATAAWAVPRGYPKDFYEIHTWDADGTPDSTLYRWRSLVNRELGRLTNEAHKSVQLVLEYKELAMQ